MVYSDDSEPRLTGHLHVLVPGHTPSDILHIALAVVVVDRCHVREDLRAVETDPVEGGVGKVVIIVPRQLLGEEVVTASEAGDLRELTRVADCRVSSALNKLDRHSHVSGRTKVLHLNPNRL